MEIAIAKEVGFPGTALFMRTPSHGSVLLFNGHRFISAILSYNPQHKTMGYQISYSSGGIFAYGVNANYYENGKDFRIGLIPELGIIVSRFQFLYGYNFKIAGYKSVIPSGHSIRCCCYIPIIGKMNVKAYEDQKPEKKKKNNR